MASSDTEIEMAVKQLLVEFTGGTRPITLDDKPISGLGLTSLDGVDFACALEKKLGCSIPSKLNPFVADGGGAERSVSEIVKVLSPLCATTKTE